MERPKKRRNRRPKACAPCRDRKVKCNSESPCDTCRRRGHIHLCHFEDEAQHNARNIPHSLNSSTATGTLFARPDSRDSSGLHESTTDPALTSPLVDDELIRQLNKIADRMTEVRSVQTMTGETVWLGRNASVSVFQHLDSYRNSHALASESSWEAVFGLSNRTTLHPFGSLWATAAPSTLANVLRALPATEVCTRYIRTYRQVVKPCHPFVLDFDAFEARLCAILPRLSELGLESALQSAVNEGSFHDAAWYGLFFGILGAGCQFSDSEIEERIPRTRVFVACAFECLRLANLYGCPSLEVIQTLLLISSTIANDCNPGVAFNLLGLITQQCRSLGLHVRQKYSSSDEDYVHPLWKATVTFESMLCFAFDRTPTCSLPSVYRPARTQKPGTSSGYQDAIYTLHSLALDWQAASRTEPPSTQLSTSLARSIIAAIDRHSLNSTPNAQTIQDRLESLAYTIQAQAIRASILRSISLSKQSQDSYRIHCFREMLDSLRKTVKAFLELKSLSPLALVSWSILHCTTSSALLLAALDRQPELSNNLLLRLWQSLQSEVDKLDGQSLTIEKSSLPYGPFLDTLTSVALPSLSISNLDVESFNPT